MASEHGFVVLVAFGWLCFVSAQHEGKCVVKSLRMDFEQSEPEAEPATTVTPNAEQVTAPTFNQYANMWTDDMKLRAWPTYKDLFRDAVTKQTLSDLSKERPSSDSKRNRKREIVLKEVYFIECDRIHQEDIAFTLEKDVGRAHKFQVTGNAHRNNSSFELDWWLTDPEALENVAVDGQENNSQLLVQITGDTSSFTVEVKSSFPPPETELPVHLEAYVPYYIKLLKLLSMEAYTRVETAYFEKLPIPFLHSAGSSYWALEYINTVLSMRSHRWSEICPSESSETGGTSRTNRVTGQIVFLDTEVLDRNSHHQMFTQSLQKADGETFNLEVDVINLPCSSFLIQEYGLFLWFHWLSEEVFQRDYKLESDFFTPNHLVNQAIKVVLNNYTLIYVVYFLVLALTEAVNFASRTAVTRARLSKLRIFALVLIVPTNFIFCYHGHLISTYIIHFTSTLQGELVNVLAVFIWLLYSGLISGFVLMPGIFYLSDLWKFGFIHLEYNSWPQDNESKDKENLLPVITPEATWLPSKWPPTKWLPQTGSKRTSSKEVLLQALHSIITLVTVGNLCSCLINHFLPLDYGLLLIVALIFLELGLYLGCGIGYSIKSR